MCIWLKTFDRLKQIVKIIKTNGDSAHSEHSNNVKIKTRVTVTEAFGHPYSSSDEEPINTSGNSNQTVNSTINHEEQVKQPKRTSYGGFKMNIGQKRQLGFYSKI